MYRCYNPKRFLKLLLCDAAAIVLLAIFSAIGKFVFSADVPQEGVFLPVVMYHSVTSDTTSDYQITAEQFEADLQYLAEHGYQTVSVAQLLEYTQGRGTLPEHPILLTFDDGFYNNLSLALPLLKEYDMCAVVAVVGRYTDVDAAADPHMDAYSYLNWEDIQALLDSECIEIGSHTYDLHSMEGRAGCSIRFGEDKVEYAAMLREDLTHLQNRMQEELGVQPVIFSYPYGYICKESVPILKELGFVCSLTCYERPNYITRNPQCLFALDRYNRSGFLTTEEFFERVTMQE